MKIVVVIPTYNEAGYLGTLIDGLFAQRIGDGVDLHILIVDDASPDGTAEVAAAAGRRWPRRVEVLPRSGKLGLASAYASGFDHAMRGGADYIGQMDGDGSHDPSALPRMYAALAGSDLVIGSRYVPEVGGDRRVGWYRRAGSRVANLAVLRCLRQLPVRDPTSGYRLWRRAALQRVDPVHRVRSRGYGFQVETAFLAACCGCRMTEVPIEFNDRRAGRSKMTFLVQLKTVAEIAAVPRTHRDLADAWRRRQASQASPPVDTMTESTPAPEERKRAVP